MYNLIFTSHVVSCGFQVYIITWSSWYKRELFLLWVLLSWSRIYTIGTVRKVQCTVHEMHIGRLTQAVVVHGGCWIQVAWGVVRWANVRLWILANQAHDQKNYMQIKVNTRG